MINSDDIEAFTESRHKVILVCGGRGYGYTPESGFKEKDLAVFNWSVDFVKRLTPTAIIQGEAKGADEVGKGVAKVMGIPCKGFGPKWRKYGAAAGPIRNKQMLDEGKPDLVVAFPGGKGTADMVRKAKKAGVEVIEV